MDFSALGAEWQNELIRWGEVRGGETAVCLSNGTNEAAGTSPRGDIAQILSLLHVTQQSWKALRWWRVDVGLNGTFVWKTKPGTHGRTLIDSGLLSWLIILRIIFTSKHSVYEMSKNLLYLYLSPNWPSLNCFFGSTNSPNQRTSLHLKSGNRQMFWYFCLTHTINWLSQ